MSNLQRYEGEVLRLELFFKKHKNLFDKTEAKRYMEAIAELQRLGKIEMPDSEIKEIAEKAWREEGIDL